jgi:hypothetical protein
MKNKNLIYFIGCLVGVTLFRCTPSLDLPKDLPNLKPIFSISADIEGRSKPFLFETVGQNRVDITNNFGFAATPDIAPINVDHNSFLYPNPSYPFLKNANTVTNYFVSGQISQTPDFFQNPNPASVYVDDSLISTNSFSFSYSTKQLPRKIVIVSDKDKKVYQEFFNPAEKVINFNLSILDPIGIKVNAADNSFKWNTGSTNSVTPIDSSADSKYYCVTVTDKNPDIRATTCALLKKQGKQFSFAYDQPWFAFVNSSFTFPTSECMGITFTDDDGIIYHSELGEQPSSSFIAIDKIEKFQPDDFTPFSFFNSTNLSNLTFKKLDIRFDCVLYTIYGKKIHLKNGKGTIIVETF